MTVIDELSAVPAQDCRCVRVSPEGTSLLTIGGGLAEVRDTMTGQAGWSRPWLVLAEFPVEAAWDPGGDTVTVLSSGRLGLVDAITGADRAVPGDLAGRTDVTAIAMSPDGHALAVGTQAGNVLLWSQDSGQVTRLRGGGDPVTAVAWRAGSAELCVARPRSVQFWRLPAEAMISSVDVGDIYPLRLAWTPDGALVAVAGLHEIRMVNAVTRSESAARGGLPGRPVGFGFSRTGIALVLAVPDGTIEVFDQNLRRSPLRLARLTAGPADPACLHVNETGLLALRTSATSVSVFGLPDTLPPEPARITAVATTRWAAQVARTVGRAARAEVIAPVPEVLTRRSGFAWASGGWVAQDRGSGIVTRYGEDGGRRWQAEARPGRITCQGGFVVISGEPGGHAIAVLDAETGAAVASLEGAGLPSWSSHGLVVSAPGRLDLLVYDPAWSGVRRIPAPEQAGDPQWSPDGRLLAAASARAALIWSAGERFTRLPPVPTGDSPRPGAVLWSPNGRWLAVDRPGGRVAVYDTRSWTAGHPLEESTAGDSPLAFAWSPDSRLLAIPSARTLGAVSLWDVKRAVAVMTIPAPPSVHSPATAVAWHPDGRFAVTHDDGTVVRWTFTLPVLPGDEQAGLGFPPGTLAELAAATAVSGTMVSLRLLADLLGLLSGADPGRLAELDGHPGVALLRSLRWPLAAAVGLAVLVASGLPPENGLVPPREVLRQDARVAVQQALGGVPVPAEEYRLSVPDLVRELDRIDDSVLVLAALLGPDAVAAEPDLLVRVRGQSFAGWSLAPRQRKLLGLRSAVRDQGDVQGQGVGDTRAGIARNGQLPWLLPSQLALPRPVLAVKKARDELLFRTRQGSLPTSAMSVVLLLDDTPAAFGAVGVTLRIVANLLASLAIRRHRRCALITLGNPVPRLLTEASDLVHVWANGMVGRPELTAALAAATTTAAQLSDPVDGLPQLVLLTHPYLECPPRPGLHVVRVHYPGLPVEATAPRTHILAPDASPDQFRDVVAAILSDDVL